MSEERDKARHIIEYRCVPESISLHKNLILLERLHSSALLSDDPATGLLPRSFKRFGQQETNLNLLDGMVEVQTSAALTCCPSLLDNKWHKDLFQIVENNSYENTENV